MDFKFDGHVFRDFPGVISKYFYKRGVEGSRDYRNFWALNSYSFKIVKATDFKFDAHVSRDITP